MKKNLIRDNCHIYFRDLSVSFQHSGIADGSGMHSGGGGSSHRRIKPDRISPESFSGTGGPRQSWSNMFQTPETGPPPSRYYHY